MQMMWPGHNLARGLLTGGDQVLHGELAIATTEQLQLIAWIQCLQVLFNFLLIAQIRTARPSFSEIVISSMQERDVKRALARLPERQAPALKRDSCIETSAAAWLNAMST
jgi:hypothetical protein